MDAKSFAQRIKDKMKKVFTLSTVIKMLYFKIVKNYKFF